MKNQIIEFNVTDAALNELAILYADVKVPTSAAERKALGANHSKIVSLRTAVEARRKELKADALAYGRKVDDTARPIREKLEAIEKPLVDAKKQYDDEKERIKQEKFEADQKRRNDILARIADFHVPANELYDMPLDQMREKLAAAESIEIDDTFEEFKDRAAEAREQSITEIKAAIAKAEYRERIAAEQAEEAKRLAAERQKLADEQAEQQKKLDAERLEMERQQAELAAAQKKIDDANAAAEAERRAEELAKEKLAAELAERERLEAEAKAAKERAEAAMPGRAKMQAYIDAISAVEVPMIRDMDDHNVLMKVADMVVDATDTLQSYLNSRSKSA